MTRSGRIFEVLIIALPVVLIYLLWMSTSGAPQRFHMIIFGCYLTPSLIGLVLAKKKRRYLRATVAAHLLLLLIYAGVAISQWVSYRTTPSHHGENLSGFLWVSIYMLLAFLTPIIFLSIWIGTSQKSDALKGAPDKPQRPVDPDKATH